MKAGDPGCIGICITAAEVGVPTGAIAYPHPHCPVHGWPVVGGGCECWVTPEHMWTTYGDAVEPGSRVEWNPECPAHKGVGG